MMILFFVITAYLLGSISFAVLMSKAFNLPDPRTYGSHNPGATNVLRSGRKVAAALTLLGDAAKGWAAVFVTKHFFATINANGALLIDAKGVQVIALVALAVFLGHLFPVFLRFKGGKGVATTLGILLGLNMVVGLGALLTWLFVAMVFRFSSLAALTAAALAPIYVALVGLPAEWVLATSIISLLLIWRHKSNIQNLKAGKETRIGKRKTAPKAIYNNDNTRG